MVDIMDYTKKQQKIIDSTIDIIISKGIDCVTTRSIANSLKITDPALYNHFASKDDILAAVCDEALNEYDVIWNQIDLLEGRGIERIRQVYLSRCKAHDQNPKISYVQTNAAVIFRNYPELAEKFSKYIKRDEDFAVNLVKEAQRLGEVRDDVDAKDLTQVVSGAFLMIQAQWIARNFTPGLYEQGKKMWNVVNTLLSPSVGVKQRVTSGETAPAVLKL